ncbi:hypothetical protein GCM10027176_65760 [Actinoallomurus bryophytorum]|uniref:Uncharacterized protein n=1 Tax=Actinoallomurus bryophytorum TaxID=1490222 RepID=A0A543CGX0_9ACTN|nr:hypothetical protein [Actinoallomurus bryophytorum]TQL96353.1 hypothetical protein FB559_1879 [Actinoallomurus bryophytorum]
MSYDPLEWTTRDPLEETSPDPIPRRRRLNDGWRHAIEVVALILLVPGLLAAEWVDGSKQSRQWQTKERVTVVRRGGTGTLGHVKLRLLGRDTTGALKSSTTPAGGVNLKLVVTARPLDAQGVKSIDILGFTVRDRAGHVWSAFPSTDRDRTKAVGTDTEVSVTATVPERLVSSVVLEVRPGALASKGPAATPVLRFAH